MRDMVTEISFEWAGGEPPVLAARGLSLERGGQRLVCDITLAIRAGRRTMIMGANGAGKSLLLRLLHGLLPPTRGEILWQGRPLDRTARRAQAMVFQRPVLLRRSVLGNLNFALGAKGFRSFAKAERAAWALEIAHLGGLAHRPARLLSQGEQQRLALARAIACEPKLLFLDEPTSSLDPASTQMIEALIDAAHARGVTIVMVTHDLGQARRMGDDVIFLHDGRIAETGNLQSVLSHPEAEATRAWLEGRLYAPLSRQKSQPLRSHK